MAVVTHGDVSGFMGIATFGVNTEPTATQVGNDIDRAESLVNQIPGVSLTTEQKEHLVLLKVASWIVRAKGIVDESQGTLTAESYHREYRDTVRDHQAAAQYRQPNTETAYGKPRKVNG